MSDILFVAGIVKGLVERSDPYVHFGSLGGFQGHITYTRSLGLVDDNEDLTPKGRLFYVAGKLADLPRTRAYVWPLYLKDVEKDLRDALEDIV